MTRQIQEAYNEALQLSREYRGRTFYVFQLGNQIAVSGHPFVIKERILDHWNVIAKTQDGFFIL